MTEPMSDAGSHGLPANDNQVLAGKREIEAFTFGDPESVLDRSERPRRVRTTVDIAPHLTEPAHDETREHRRPAFEVERLRARILDLIQPAEHLSGRGPRRVQARAPAAGPAVAFQGRTSRRS